MCRKPWSADQNTYLVGSHIKVVICTKLIHRRSASSLASVMRSLPVSRCALPE